MSVSFAPIVRPFPPWLLWLRRCGHLLLHLLAALVHAQQLARERAQLADMDEAALQDIGLTQADMLAELRKPFWRR